MSSFRSKRYEAWVVTQGTSLVPHPKNSESWKKVSNSCGCVASYRLFTVACWTLTLSAHLETWNLWAKSWSSRCPIMLQPRRSIRQVSTSTLTASRFHHCYWRGIYMSGTTAIWKRHPVLDLVLEIYIDYVDPCGWRMSFCTAQIIDVSITLTLLCPSITTREFITKELIGKKKDSDLKLSNMPGWLSHFIWNKSIRDSWVASFN